MILTIQERVQTIYGEKGMLTSPEGQLAKLKASVYLPVIIQENNGELRKLLIITENESEPQKMSFIGGGCLAEQSIRKALEVFGCREYKNPQDMRCKVPLNFKDVEHGTEAMMNTLLEIYDLDHLVEDIGQEIEEEVPGFYNTIYKKLESGSITHIKENISVVEALRGDPDIVASLILQNFFAVKVQSQELPGIITDLSDTSDVVKLTGYCIDHTVLEKGLYKDHHLSRTVLAHGFDMLSRGDITFDSKKKVYIPESVTTIS